MEIQIIVMSILSYLILFNCSLTFRLNLKNNIVITTMLVFNIVLIREYIGSLFVIPMFTVIILYVCYLKRQDWLWNVFLIIFSYTLLVVVDNLTHFVWSIIGMDLSIHWPIYMLIDYPVFYVVCRLTSKKVVEIKRKYFLPLSPKILIILGADLILCMLIFVMNIMVTEQAGSPPRVLFTSIILYIAYVVLTFLIVATIVYEYETNANIMMKQNSYDNLQEYMKQIEELYQNMRVFRHDYANVMLSVVGYIEENDMDGLKKYYDMEEEDFLSAELEIVPAGKARDCGLDRSMVLAYGQDDRVCAFTSLFAILDTPQVTRTGCCILVDKEEIGSVGATGMHSRFFENVVAELVAMTDGESELKVRRALQNSRMLSSDVSAAYDPMYADVFEKRSSAFFGKGLVFNKFTGSRGKSGSNDANAEYLAKIRGVMDDADVSYQFAELGKVDAGGGGTIAYIMANYGMEVIDSGVAVLSMHAPWEVTSKADVYEAYKGYVAFLKNM